MRHYIPQLTGTLTLHKAANVAYTQLNYAREKEQMKEGAGWSLALSLPLLWCHKCEPELWIFTSVQRTNPMSIKGYRAAAKQEERNEGEGD